MTSAGLPDDRDYPGERSHTAYCTGCGQPYTGNKGRALRRKCNSCHQATPKAMSRITIPDTSKNRDAGITYKHGIAYARYTENGKQVRRKIGDECESHAVVRGNRDAVYQDLLNHHGAKVASKKGPKPGDLNAKRRLRVAADPMKYIRFEARLKLPWSVRFGRQVSGRFLTLGEAQAARDRAVGVRLNVPDVERREPAPLPSDG